MATYFIKKRLQDCMLVFIVARKNMHANNILLKVVLFESHLMIGMLTLVTNIVHKMG